MIELKLRRTWHEISEYLASNYPNPLRIAKLVNRVRPCCWTFRFTFDGTGRITVAIDCNLAVSDNDALALLDGSLEEVLLLIPSICAKQENVSPRMPPNS